jgi:peptidoglycan/xylan/chitin deacetylase (PgdA/CDA1 family)
MVGEIASAGVAAGLAAGGYAYAAMWPTSQLFGHTIIAGNDPLEVALTFDDGPNGVTTQRLLELLARENVTATFFLIGRYVREQPEIVREIAAAGHLIGNHTMTHPKLLLCSPRRIENELRDAKWAIEDLIGRKVYYFRPPHGFRRPDVLRVVRDLGMRTVMWNAMGFDWSAKNWREIVIRIERNRLRNMRRHRGSNILLHDGGHLALGAERTNTVHATSALIEDCRASGSLFVKPDIWPI